jgi:hypothetical protein
MGQLYLRLSCIVTSMAGYLGTYSAYVEWNGLRWSPGLSSTNGIRLVSRSLPQRLLTPARPTHYESVSSSVNRVIARDRRQSRGLRAELSDGCWEASGGTISIF